MYYMQEAINNHICTICNQLEKQGHKVYSANNGKDALLRLGMDRNEIDVILLDIVMPEMNGFEVLKYIKTDKRFFEIPVIMISSMDDTDSIYRCIEHGADDYITNPFDKSLLDARIISCIEKKHLRDKEKRLIGLMLFDHQKDGLSAVYSFYDVKFEKSGLGNFMILELIELAKKLTLDLSLIHI